MSNLMMIAATLALVFALTVAAEGAGDVGGAGAAESKPVAKPRLVSPPQKTVDAAAKYPQVGYSRRYKGGAHTNGAWGGGSRMILAVAAYAGNASADKPFLEQIRYNLKGNKCISANGGYPAQHERHFTGGCTLAKLTPRVWNKLSKAEKHKIDLAMKAALVASAYTTSDAGYAGGKKTVALDGDGNMNRDWNPNYQEGMVGMMIVGPVYFGPKEAKKILDTYDHEAFVAELKAAGLDNIHETFNWKAAKANSKAPSGKQIEQIIRNYRFKGMGLDDPLSLYHKLTTRTYGEIVSAGLHDGKGIGGGGKIASGAEGLPNKGKRGMLKEFASNDGKGRRSSITYAYDGFRPNLTNQIVLIAGGYWKKNAKTKECVGLLNVGVTDLFYKLEHGYIGYSHGKPGKKAHDMNTKWWDHHLTRSLWNDVMKPYHAGKR